MFLSSRCYFLGVYKDGDVSESLGSSPKQDVRPPIASCLPLRVPIKLADRTHTQARFHDPSHAVTHSLPRSDLIRFLSVDTGVELCEHQIDESLYLGVHGLLVF